MYVVIFRATIQQLDAEYINLAQSLRQKAFKDYHCQKFESYTEGNQEIALSYWLKLDDIRAWRNDPEHRLAQQHGKEKWYTEFSVEICQCL